MADEQVEETKSAAEHGNLVQLARRLENGCSLDELHELYFQLGIAPFNLPGSTKSALARKLVQHCRRRDRLDELEEAFSRLPAGCQDRLAEYRRRLLQETEFVELRGIPLPMDRDGRPRTLRVPLDKI